MRGEVSLMFARTGMTGRAVKEDPIRTRSNPMSVEPTSDQGQTLSYPRERANIAAEHGPRRLIHFGFLAINWLTV